MGEHVGEPDERLDVNKLGRQARAARWPTREDTDYATVWVLLSGSSWLGYSMLRRDVDDWIHEHLARDSELLVI